MDYYNLPSGRSFLVAVKGFILNAKNELLLLKVADDDPSTIDRGRWNLPGGLVEMDEKLEDALRREIYEETGLAANPSELIGVDSFERAGFQFNDGTVKDVRVIVIGYLCNGEYSSVRLDNEHTAHEWVGISKLPDMQLTPNSRGLARQFLSKKSSSP